VNSFKQDYTWPLAFLAQIKTIVGPLLFEPAPLEIDQNEVLTSSRTLPPPIASPATSSPSLRASAHRARRGAQQSRDQHGARRPMAFEQQGEICLPGARNNNPGKARLCDAFVRVPVRQ